VSKIAMADSGDRKANDEIGHQWDRDYFMDMMDRMTDVSRPIYFEFKAIDLMQHPDRVGYSRVSYPGGKRLREVRTRVARIDPEYDEAADSVSRICMAMKLLNVGATHGAEHKTRDDNGVDRNWVIPVVLE